MATCLIFLLVSGIAGLKPDIAENGRVSAQDRRCRCKAVDAKSRILKGWRPPVPRFCNPVHAKC